MLHAIFRGFQLHTDRSEIVMLCWNTHIIHCLERLGMGRSRSRQVGRGANGLESYRFRRARLTPWSGGGTIARCVTSDLSSDYSMNCGGRERENSTNQMG